MQSKPERRKSQRRLVLKKAKLLISSPKLTLDAIIRDVSETGVKLQLIFEVALPDQFELIFVSEYTRQHARLIWQKGLLVGVELTGPTSPIKLPRLVLRKSGLTQNSDRWDATARNTGVTDWFYENGQARGIRPS